MKNELNVWMNIIINFKSTGCWHLFLLLLLLNVMKFLFEAWWWIEHFKVGKVFICFFYFHCLLDHIYNCLRLCVIEGHRSSDHIFYFFGNFFFVPHVFFFQIQVKCVCVSLCDLRIVNIFYDKIIYHHDDQKKTYE